MQNDNPDHLLMVQAALKLLTQEERNQAILTAALKCGHTSNVDPRELQPEQLKHLESRVHNALIEAATKKYKQKQPKLFTQPTPQTPCAATNAQWQQPLSPENTQLIACK